MSISSNSIQFISFTFGTNIQQHKVKVTVKDAESHRKKTKVKNYEQMVIYRRLFNTDINPDTKIYKRNLILNISFLGLDIRSRVMVKCHCCGCGCVL